MFIINLIAIVLYNFFRTSYGVFLLYLSQCYAIIMLCYYNLKIKEGKVMNRTKLYNIFLTITLICLIISTLLAFFILKDFIFKVFFFSFLLVLFISWFSKQKVLSSKSTSPYYILATVMSILIFSFIICASFMLGRFTISHLL